MYTSSILFFTLCIVVISAQPDNRWSSGCCATGGSGKPCGGLNRGPCMVVKKKASKLIGNKVQNQVGDITDVQLTAQCTCDQGWDCTDCARGCPICCPPCPDSC